MFSPSSRAQGISLSRRSFLKGVGSLTVLTAIGTLKACGGEPPVGPVADTGVPGKSIPISLSGPNSTNGMSYKWLGGDSYQLTGSPRNGGTFGFYSSQVAIDGYSYLTFKIKGSLDLLGTWSSKVFKVEINGQEMKWEYDAQGVVNLDKTIRAPLPSGASTIDKIQLVFADANKVNLTVSDFRLEE
ncbi:twin-arginine translocation signal domain-containing protein [Candidatus Margulisiibacteriota bacterium]